MKVVFALLVVLLVLLAFRGNTFTFVGQGIYFSGIIRGEKSTYLIDQPNSIIFSFPEGRLIEAGRIVGWNGNYVFLEKGGRIFRYDPFEGSSEKVYDGDVCFFSEFDGKLLVGFEEDEEVRIRFMGEEYEISFPRLTVFYRNSAAFWDGRDTYVFSDYGVIKGRGIPIPGDRVILVELESSGRRIMSKAYDPFTGNVLAVVQGGIKASFSLRDRIYLVGEETDYWNKVGSIVVIEDGRIKASLENDMDHYFSPEVAWVWDGEVWTAGDLQGRTVVLRLCNGDGI